MQAARIAIALLATGAGLGCSASPAGDGADSDSAFSSNKATLYEFAFESEVSSTSDDGGGIGATTSWKALAKLQLFHTVGILNGKHGVGRIGGAELELASQDGGTIRYRAKMPVAWTDASPPPADYEMLLPRSVASTDLQRLIQENGQACLSLEARGHDVDPSNLWFFFEPARTPECKLAAPGNPDVVKVKVRATKSSANASQARYPEYDRVWKDGELRVAAVFTKALNEGDDEGEGAYRDFVQAMKSEHGLASQAVDTPPAGMQHAELDGAPTAGRMHVSAFLLDNLAHAPAEFDDAFKAISGKADLVIVNGHAAFGGSVQSLSGKGVIDPGQYQIFFFNQCDTYAYLGSTLPTRKAQANPDDPNGTLYLDIVTNVIPVAFSRMTGTTREMIRALVDRRESYGEIFDAVARVGAANGFIQLGRQTPPPVLVVTGDEDNPTTPPSR